MTGKIRNVLVILMAVVMIISVFAACGSNNKGNQQSSTGNASTEASTGSSELSAEVTFDTAKDSSELPDWTGKKLNLVWWRADSTGDAERFRPANDVIWPEIERVTGVKFDPDKSFDNGGLSLDAKFSQLAAANAWPNVVMQMNDTFMIKAVQAGLLWDLTDLLPKYGPHILKRLPPDKLKELYNSAIINGGQSGKIYAIPTYLREKYYIECDPDLDIKKWNEVNTPQDPVPYVWIRDDILKKLYPNAKTEQEIKDLYVKNGGKFTKEEIFDVPINSKEDFFKLLYDIKKLNIKEDGKEVYPFYVWSGTDNWSLFTCMGGIWGWNMGEPSFDPSYFTYWDKEKQKIDFMFKQDFFKSALHDITKLVQDGVASKESIIDNNQTFIQKMNNGLYAVVYPQAVPNNALLKQKGKPYQYRRLWLNIPQNTQKFVFSGGVPNETRQYAFFKSTMSEEDVIQTIKMFDYLASDVGLKMVAWGPKSAGLFDEDSNGNRTWKDKDLEDAFVYLQPNDKAKNTGLYVDWPYISLGIPRANVGWPWVPCFPNKYSSYVTYNKKINPEQADARFRPGYIEPAKQTIGQVPLIVFFSGKVPEVDRFWKTRNDFELSLVKIFTAKNDAEFEKLYKDFVDKATKNGLTDETAQACDKVWKEDINKDYMQYWK